ncbi:MAG: hypothetical protein ACO20O_07185 [Pseudomonadales bacterium]
MKTVDLPAIEAQSLDPNLYILTDDRYLRIGRVRSTRTGTQILYLEPKISCECVLVLAKPTARQFLGMMDPTELNFIGMQLSRAVSMAILGTSARPGYAIETEEFRSLLSDALKASLEDETFLKSQAALADYARREINPAIISELKSILTSRILEATEVIIDDAFENYGMDFFQGHFSIAPLTEAIDNLLFDPRVLAIWGDIVTQVMLDDEINTATQTLIDRYIQNLIKALGSTDVATGDKVAAQVTGAFRNLLETGAELVSVGGKTHPVILGMLRNELLPDRTRSDGLLIIMDRDRARDWFPASSIYEIEENLLG